MSSIFDHDKLNVYREAIDFIAWCEPILQAIPKNLAIHDQLDRASTSIVLNIAEGNGKFSIKDRCRYLDIARGSALESAACLDVLIAKKRFRLEELKEGKKRLHGIVSMLMGLRASLADRVSEEGEEYHGSVGGRLIVEE